MYKLIQPINPSTVRIVLRVADTSFIPIDELNADYKQFKKDMENGAELQDIDGNVMTQEQIQEFLATLP